MTTVGRLARQFGLSRSTLLYYDRKGVLSPSGRSEKGYRVYSATDAEQLGLICLYRKAGLSLDAIGQVLSSRGQNLNATLNRRLAELEKESGKLQEQQRLILSLLKREPPENLGRLDKNGWMDLLAASGFSKADMRAWHMGFEKSAPRKHRAFLEYLGVPTEEISEIRHWSKDGNQA
jgi:DNA-binding transcriptional MerR regulator